MRKSGSGRMRAVAVPYVQAALRRTARTGPGSVGTTSASDFTGQQLELPEPLEHERDRVLRRRARGVDAHLGRLRLLVRIAHAGEVGHLARERPRVEALRVAAHTVLERGRDVH